MLREQRAESEAPPQTQLIYPYLSDVNFYNFRIIRMWVKHKAVCEAMQHALNHISARL